MKAPGSISGALAMVINAFVFAGLPTTKTLTFLFAQALIAFPWIEKIPALPMSKSLRSMPGPLGFAPTKKA